MVDSIRTSHARQLAGGASLVFAAAAVLGVLAARAPDAGAAPAKRLSRASALAKGKFLVAGRDLLDPNFARTVVLLVEYSDKGAMGVIVNRPTEMKLSRLWPDLKKLAERPDTLYAGGPVAPGHMLMLVRGEESERSQPVLEDLAVSSSQEWLAEMIAVGLPAERLRVFSGHAGWAPGQLDWEVERGGWFIWRGDSDTVFSAEPGEKVWQRLLRYSSSSLADGSTSTGRSTPSFRLASVASRSAPRASQRN